MATKKSGQKEQGSIEIYFAKRLANNDAKVRNRAVRRMKLWLSSKPGESFGELDMMKLWKGLFYCMWFSDKPIVQEDLANLIAKLIHILKDVRAVSMFVDAFFLTMGREWYGIDSLRMDKFYMLMRRVLREVFVYLQAKHWDEETVFQISKALFNGPCNVKTNKFPDSVIVFMAEIFVGELRLQMKDSKPGECALTKLFEPFISVFAKFDSTLVSKCINDEIFRSLLPRKSQAFNMLIKIDLKTFGSKMFEEAANACITARKRKNLFNLSKLFKEAALKLPGGDLSFVEKENEDESEKPLKKTSKRKPMNENKSVRHDKRKKVCKDNEELKDNVVADSNNSDLPEAEHNGDECHVLVDDIRMKLEFESPTAAIDATTNKSRKLNGLRKVKTGRKSRKVTSSHDEKVSHSAEVDTNTSDTKTADNVSISEESRVRVRRNIKGNKFNKKPRTLECRSTRRKSQQQKERIVKDGRITKKKVVFELSKNAVTSISSLKINPARVFTPEQKPIKGVLKTSNPRKQACDFF